MRAVYLAVVLSFCCVVCFGQKCDTAVSGNKIIASVAEICVGETVIFKTKSTAKLSVLYSHSFVWSVDTDITRFTSVSNSNFDSLTYKFNSPGTYYIKRKISVSFACIDISDTLTIKVYPKPTAKITSAKSTICNGDKTTLSVAFTGKDPWKFTYKIGSNKFTVKDIKLSPYSFDVNPAATTTYTIDSVFDANCNDTSTSNIKITVNPIPATPTILNNGPLCVGKKLELTTSAVTNAVYVWKGPKSFTSSSQNPTISAVDVSHAGDYELIIVVNGCSSSIGKTTLVVNNLPVANAGSNQTICNGESAQIGSAAVTGNTYSWTSIPSGFTSTTSNPTVSPTTTSKSITVKYILEVTNANGCKNIDEVEIIVNPKPVAKFTFATGCEYDSVKFTNTATISDGTMSYEWDFGDNGTIYKTNLKTSFFHNYKAGKYKAILKTISALGCVDTVSHEIIVHPQPLAIFTAASACEYDSTTFINSSAGIGLTYSWDFGNSKKSTLANPKFKFVVGSHKVTLTVTSDKGCTAKVERTIRVNPEIKPGFTTQNKCIYENVSFINTTGIQDSVSRYLWLFGDGQESSEKNPAPIKYAAAGTYTVSLITISNRGCADTIKSVVTIYPQPKADFDFTAGCEYESVKFLNKSNGSTDYIWSFDDGNPTTSTKSTAVILKNFAAGKQYKVKLIAINTNGCTDTIEKLVTVSPKPTANFDMVASSCEKDVVKFDNNSKGANSYLWKFGDNTTSTAADPVKAFSAPGTYVIWLISATTSNCIDSVSKTITIFPRAVPLFDFKNSCLDSSVTFTNTTTVSAGTVTYEWDFEDGAKSTDQNPKKTFSKPGIYNVKVVATTNNGCKDSVAKRVNIYPIPKADFSFTNRCLDSAIIFTDKSNVDAILNSKITNWEWNFGDGGGTSALANPQHIYAKPGKYFVSLKVTTATGCSNTFTDTTVIVYAKPSVPVFTSAPATALCRNAQGVNYSIITDPELLYKWETKDAELSVLGQFQPNTIINFPNKSGNYEIKVTATNKNGCKRDTTITVNVSDKPSPQPAKIIEKEANTLVCLDNSATTYQWGFDDKKTLIPNIIAGAVNQDYSSVKLDLVNNYYWVVTGNDEGCQTKSYFNSIVGIQPQAENDLSFDIYPNPNKGNFSLRFSNQKNEIAGLQILDYCGKQVYEKKYLKSDNQKEIRLTISDLHPGIYMLILHDKNGFPVTKKFVVY